MLISSAERNDAMWSINKYIMSEFQVFDDEVIVYQQGSGFTHLINLFGAEILNLLLAKPRSIQEITELLIESTENIQKEELGVHVHQYLEHCLQLDIVNFQPDES